MIATISVRSGISARPAGFEPATFGFEVCCSKNASGKEGNDFGQERSAAYTALITKLSSDPDFARIVAAWPTLPDTVRASILAMVRAAGNE